MTYLEIQAFLTIAETGSVSKAAELLYISQPALSYRLQTLEKELNCQLIERQQGVRKSTLTDAGMRFIPIAERWKKLWSETKELQNTHTPLLKIGGAQSLNSCILSHAYQLFLDRHTPYSLSIVTQSSKQLYQSVENMEIDIGFLANPMYSNRMITTPLLKESMFFVCTRTMDISDIVHPQFLNPQKQILINWSKEFTIWNDFWFGDKTPPLICTDDTPMIENLIIANGGWAVVPDSVSSNFHQTEKIKVLPIESGPPDRISYVITKGDSILSPAITMLLDDVRKASTNMGISFLL